MKEYKTMEIDTEKFSEEQKLVIDVLINEGRLRENEEILDMLTADLYTNKGEDPYFEYAVRAIAQKIKERYNA